MFLFLADGLADFIWEQNSPEGMVINLAGPLGAGQFTVMQGGARPSLNHHSTVTAQRYALDIVGRDSWGRRAQGFAPTALSDYYIYDTPVLAPCDGEVLLTENHLPEVPAGKFDSAAAKTPLGNTVLLHCTSDITVVLAHLRPGTVEVKQGQPITAQTPLARVGNSGNTSEPHLHIHAVQGRVRDPLHAITDALGVPLTIDGHFLSRRDTL